MNLMTMRRTDLILILMLYYEFNDHKKDRFDTHSRVKWVLSLSNIVIHHQNNFHDITNIYPIAKKTLNGAKKRC